MLNKKIFDLHIIFLILLLSAPLLYGQEKEFSQTLSWEEDENAFSYRVELQSLEDKSLQSFETEDSSIKLKLKPGKYKYKIYALDFLGRDASESDWQDFTVIKAMKPVIEDLPANLLVADNEKVDFSVPVDVSSITKETSVVIVNTKSKEEIKGSLKFITRGEEIIASNAVFPEVSEGNWVIKITNPSGLMSQTEEIEVTKTIEEALVIAEENPEKRLDANILAQKIKNEEEAERLEKERLAAERLEAERLEKERLAAERLEAERLEKERLAAERLEAERLEKERLEAERLEAERLEKERLAAERLEAERLEKERLEAERLANEKLEAEKLEAERLALAEKARLVEKRLEEERLKAEKLAEEERLAKEKEELAKAEEKRQMEEKIAQAKQVLEKVQKEEEARLEAERIAKEEADRKAEEARIEEALEAQRQLALEKRKKNRDINYYDINFMAGGVAFFQAYGNSLLDYSDLAQKIKVLPLAQFSLSYLPIDFGRSRLGFEVNFQVVKIKSETDYFTMAMPYVSPHYNFYYQQKLVSDILYLGIRAGASISILGLDVKYKDDLVNRNDNFEETYYMFPGIQSGLSLIYRPLIFLEIELGCDLEHIFMQGSYSGVIKGFMNLGLRI